MQKQSSCALIGRNIRKCEFTMTAREPCKMCIIHMNGGSAREIRDSYEGEGLTLQVKWR